MVWPNNLCLHEKICLASLNILAHGVMNLLYYEHWTNNQKYFLHLQNGSRIITQPLIITLLPGNCPLDNCPWIITPWKLPPEIAPRIIAPQTIASSKIAPRTFGTWIIAHRIVPSPQIITPRKLLPVNCPRQFFQGKYFIHF